MIQRREIEVEGTQLSISVFRWKNKNTIRLIIYIHDNEVFKKRLVEKLLGTEGISISGAEILSFYCTHEISENLFELLEFLAPVDMRENNELKKIAKEYLDGTIEREMFEQEVIAHCVADKLSK